MLNHIRRYLIAGLLVWIPIAVTFLVIRFIVNLLDSSLTILPYSVRPDIWFGVHIPFVGLVLFLIVLFFTGMLATNLFGQRLVDYWDRLINRIPLVRSIYTGVQQVTHAFFSPTGVAFRRVLLIEYPRQGIWTIAFQTSDSPEEIAAHVGKNMISVFVPTTPNPTSGFFLMVPTEEAIVLSISVEQALKLVISLGVVQPTKNGQIKKV